MQTGVVKRICMILRSLLLFNRKFTRAPISHVNISTRAVVEHVCANTRHVSLNIQRRTLLKRFLNYTWPGCSSSTAIVTKIRISRWAFNHRWILSIIIKFLSTFMLHMNIHLVVWAPGCVPICYRLPSVILFEHMLLRWRAWITDATT